MVQDAGQPARLALKQACGDLPGVRAVPDRGDPDPRIQGRFPVRFDVSDSSNEQYAALAACINDRTRCWASSRRTTATSAGAGCVASDVQMSSDTPACRTTTARREAVSAAAGIGATVGLAASDWGSLLDAPGVSQHRSPSAGGRALDTAGEQDHRGAVAQAADAATLLAAALFLGAVVSWLAYAASRTSDALEDDRRRAPEPQLRRAVPVTITALFAVAVVVMVVLTSARPGGCLSGGEPTSPAARYASAAQVGSARPAGEVPRPATSPAARARPRSGQAYRPAGDPPLRLPRRRCPRRRRTADPTTARAGPAPRRSAPGPPPLRSRRSTRRAGRPGSG